MFLQKKEIKYSTNHYTTAKKKRTSTYFPQAQEERRLKTQRETITKMSTAVLPSSHFRFLHESDLPMVPLPDRWHSGERLFQDRVQVREAIQGASAIFRPSLTPQHQDFVPGLNYIFVGSLDEHGRPWVSMVCGPKGFMTSPDIKTLEIQTRISTTTSDGKGEETDRARVLDPILDNLLHGESFRQGKKMWSAVALDFTNRRRNKFNGVVYPEDILKADPATGEIHVRLTVEQSIGNVYIFLLHVRPFRSIALFLCSWLFFSRTSTKQIITFHVNR